MAVVTKLEFKVTQRGRHCVIYCCFRNIKLGGPLLVITCEFPPIVEQEELSCKMTTREIVVDMVKAITVLRTKPIYNMLVLIGNREENNYMSGRLGRMEWVPDCL